MAGKLPFSNEELRVHEVDAHYTNCAEALRAYYVDTNGVFVGYTKDQLRTELHERLDELSKSCGFLLLTTIEARLRINYLKRCYERKKDPLSRRFREIYARRKEKPDLSDDLLEAWKWHGASPRLVAELKGAFHYRNWLAHGRYWKLGRKYDYLALFELASGVERLVQGAP